MESQPFNPLHILRSSSKLSAASLVGMVLSFAVSLMTGRILGPENVGVLALVGVWTFYTQLVRPGFLAAATRDMPHLIGRGELDEARRIQNIGMTGELAFVLLPFSIVFVAGFFYDTPLVRSAMWVAAVASAATTLQGMLSSTFAAYQRFDVLTRIRFVMSMVSPIGILLTLRWLGVFSPLVMPAVTGMAVLAIVWYYRDVIQYRPAWDWATGLDLMKVGLPLVALTFVGWAYFMSDRPALLAAGVSLTTLGYYSFASNLVRGMGQMTWDFTAVFQPMLYQEMGRQGSARGVSQNLLRVWVPYTAAGCAVTTFGQAGFGALVDWVAPKFAPSVPVFEMLVFILVFQNSSQLPNLLLNSKAINRQNFNVLLWTGGLALNVAVLYAVAHAGYSLFAVATASMSVDLVIALVGYACIHGYLFASLEAAIPFYGWMSGVALVSVGLYLVFQCGPFVYVAGGTVWTPLLLRTLTAAVVWSGVGLAMWQWWRPGEAVTAVAAAVLEASPQ
ncbi:MAG TPA: oligosaccharide flippase family protein [Candidatus Acidoferrales bacterium]|nr:oligosaccharide flippase family protein [Candidatus Acidoferrales bacterium]